MSRKGWLLFIAISVFWGIPYLFIKIAVRELDPTVVVFARVGIAAVVLVPVALFRGTWQQLRQQWRAIVVLSCVQIVGPFLLISYGEQHIASSLTSLLIAADPLLVALLALRFDPSERVSGLRLVGLFIGMGGVVALLGLDVGGDRQGLLGAGLVLLAAAGYAVAALLVKRPPVATLPLLGVVAAECAVLAVMRLPNRVPDLEVMVSLLVLGLICTALAYLTFYALVSEVGASRGTVFTYVNPVVSVFLGVTLLGEPLNAAMVAGFILILVGSWLSTGGALPLPLRHLIRRGLQSEAGREAGENRQDAFH
ncbi:MAG: DMT family transporter [Chloroflexi bacterium]|nr:MAG: DMT family transporter [Chloroflexota bacterium]